MSLWDSSDPSNYARRAIWKAGLKMIAAHPLTGVGPQRVSKVFYDYHDHPEDRYRDGFSPFTSTITFCNLLRKEGSLVPLPGCG